MNVFLALASGILLALSFPKFGHPAFGWIALTPLLVALGSATLWSAFTLGLIAGLVYFSGTLYWITRVMAVYGHMPVVAAGLLQWPVYAVGEGAAPSPRCSRR